MQIDTRILEDQSRREHKVVGLISVPRLQEWLAELYEGQEMDPDVDVLWDLREADFSSVKAVEIESFARMVTKHWGRGGKSKAALIVSRDLDFGLSRMYEFLMNGATSSRVMVFRNADEAEKWLAE